MSNPDKQKNQTPPTNARTHAVCAERLCVTKRATKERVGAHTCSCGWSSNSSAMVSLALSSSKITNSAGAFSPSFGPGTYLPCHEARRYNALGTRVLCCTNTTDDGDNIRLQSELGSLHWPVPTKVEVVHPGNAF